MTPQDLIDDLRSRINPAYAAQLGTESYERRLCAEALEAQADRLEVLEREHVEFFERWHGERRKREALELLCRQLYEAERDKNQQDWTAVIRALEKVGAGDTPMARLFGCCADDEDKTQNAELTALPKAVAG